MSFNGVIYDAIISRIRQREIPAGSTALIKNNYTATTNPTVNDDSTQGYEVGSRWINITSHEAYICLGNGTGAALWELNTAGTASEIIADHGTSGGTFTDVQGAINVAIYDHDFTSNGVMLRTAAGTYSNLIPSSLDLDNLSPTYYNKGTGTLGSHLGGIDVEIGDLISITPKEAHVDTLIAGSTTTIDSFVASSGKGCVWHYVVEQESGASHKQRCGIITCTWNNANIINATEMANPSVPLIDDTILITFTTDINSSNVRLRASIGAAAGNLWSVTVKRYIII